MPPPRPTTKVTVPFTTHREVATFKQDYNPSLAYEKEVKKSPTISPISLKASEEAFNRTTQQTAYAPQVPYKVRSPYDEQDSEEIEVV